MASYNNIRSNTGKGFRFILCLLIALASCGAPSPTPTTISQSANISNHELNNLIAFTRLLGYVQYFHPSDQAYNTNWEQFAEKGLSVARSAVDSIDLVEKLNNLFQPVAPTVLVFETDKGLPPAPNEVMPTTGPNQLQVVTWRHHGYGLGVRQQMYFSERIYKPVIEGAIPSDMPDPRQPFYADLGGGVSATIPLAVFVDGEGTFPHKVVDRESVTTKHDSAIEEKTRHLATVILAWNVFQHFYPYFDVVETDWLSALRDALIGANSANSEEQFINVLSKMVARLHDGHGRVQLQTTNLSRPPFGWDWIENKLVITFVEDEAKGQLRPGDIVKEIDGKPAAIVIAAQEKVVSGATPQWIRFSALKNILEDRYDSTITITLQPSFGLPYRATFDRTVHLTYGEEFLFTEQRPPTISEIKPGIWYVDLSRVTDTQFNNELDNLTKAAGIIFDMRGYPYGVSLEPISHIVDHPVAWPQLRIPVVTYPDHQKLSWDPVFQSVEPLAPHLDAKIAFITDGRAISYAESYMGIIESNQIAEIIGGATAGTNGNVVVFTLFETYTFQFTGMQVLKLDGSQHHGIGIQPTLPVKRTVNGASEGRDELLESAVAVVTQK